MTEKDLIVILDIYMNDANEKARTNPHENASYLTKGILFAMREAVNTALEQAAERVKIKRTTSGGYGNPPDKIHSKESIDLDYYEDPVGYYDITLEPDRESILNLRI